MNKINIELMESQVMVLLGIISESMERDKENGDMQTYKLKKCLMDIISLNYMKETV